MRSRVQPIPETTESRSIHRPQALSADTRLLEVRHSQTLNSRSQKSGSTIPSIVFTMEPIRPVWTNDAGSMAEDTAKNRWPQTVHKVVKELERASGLSKSDDVRREGLELARKVEDLEAEIESDQKLSPLQSDGSRETQLWNRQLADFGECSWLAAPWLFAECYLYRRLYTLLTTSKHWKEFDMFKSQKDDAFANSKAAVQELAQRYIEVVDSGHALDTDEQRRRLLLDEMTQIALWGNATDLSLLTNLSLADMGALQGAEAIAKNRRNVVSDDTETLYRYLCPEGSTQQRHPRIDIVLDNAGFEFFTDLIYASYLVHSGITAHVVLHTKAFPWFVSDVTPADVFTVLDDLERTDLFPVRNYLDNLVVLLRNHFSKGDFSIKSHPFWTTASTFHELPDRAPELYASLQQSSLVVFKGDLNYRKLTVDGLWPYTTPFKTALGPIGAESGLKVLALRTNKSDVCVGLASEEQVKALDEEAPSLAWVRNGKYAVVSFSDGK